eukprot:3678016-Pyramimonas_sp.AAC.1
MPGRSKRQWVEHAERERKNLQTEWAPPAVALGARPFQKGASGMSIDTPCNMKAPATYTSHEFRYKHPEY